MKKYFKCISYKNKKEQLQNFINVSIKQNILILLHLTPGVTNVVQLFVINGAAVFIYYFSQWKHFHWKYVITLFMG